MVFDYSFSANEAIRKYNTITENLLIYLKVLIATTLFFFMLLLLDMLVTHAQARLYWKLQP